MRGNSYIPFMLRRGDGSTLSLDFTAMSGLDSRFTFSRSSTATVINSSGLVQYATANLMTYSEDQGNNTTWSAFGTSVTRLASQSDPLGGSSAIRLSFDATSSDAVISRTVSVNNGLPYVISIWMRSDSGTVTNVRFARSDSAAGAIFPTLTTAWQRVELPFTASSANSGIEIRVLNSGSPKTATIHVFGAQLEPGSVMRSYQPATGGTAYHAPRFDYDPATLAPKGLLIEGSVTNLVTQSEAFTTGAGHWTDSNITRDGTLRTSPDGTANALRITASAGNATIIRTSAIGTSAARTFSIWLRRVTGTGNIDYTQDNGANWNTQAITSSWVRYTFTHTANHQVGIRIVTSGDAIELWGAQLEAGAGASSYIPTGASTVQRAADVCTMTGANFTSWYGAPTGWTLVTETIPQSRASTTFPGMVALRSSADSGLRIYYYNDGTYNTAFRFATASSSSEVFGPNSVTYGLARKFGASVTSGTQIASSAGVQIGSTQTLAVPMDQTVLGIGNDGATTPTVNCRMHVRNIKYWPYAMTLAQLNGVTA